MTIVTSLIDVEADLGENFAPDISSSLIDVEASLSAFVSLGRAPWPAGLPVPLQGRVHHVMPRQTVTQMETGRIRRRRMFEDPIEILDLTLNLTEDQFSRFQTFVEDDLVNGTLSTIILGNDSSSIPGVSRLIWRVVSLYPAGQYTFSRTDNLFNVRMNAELITSFFVEGDTSGNSELIGSGSPEGVVDAPPGTIYWDRVGKFQWVKEKGICRVGWREQYGGGVV